MPLLKSDNNSETRRQDHMKLNVYGRKIGIRLGFQKGFFDGF
jgi:hypothetical protein